MRVYDTYVAALQHGFASVPDAAVKIGVVRRPTRWFYPHVDHNRPELGPPPELLDDFQERHDALTARLGDAEAHNQAWADVEYDRRYLDYLNTSREATDALDEVRGLLDDGEDVVLVCYENTDEKRCHRTLLRDRLTDATA